MTRRGPNRYAVILVDERTGDRSVFWERPRDLTLRRDEIDHSVVTDARVLHVDTTDEEAAVEAARIAREADLTVTCDVDRLSEWTEKLLASVTVPILAEGVPEALAREGDPDRALRRIRQPHHRMLAVTLGSRGSMLLDGDRLHDLPACHVEVVDTTGAGDVFRGAFIHALLAGHSPAGILRFANAAAALSCTRSGAIDSVPTRAEVERLLNT